MVGATGNLTGPCWLAGRRPALLRLALENLPPSGPDLAAAITGVGAAIGHVVRGGRPRPDPGPGARGRHAWHAVYDLSGDERLTC